MLDSSSPTVVAMRLDNRPVDAESSVTFDQSQLPLPRPSSYNMHTFPARERCIPAPRLELARSAPAHTHLRLDVTHDISPLQHQQFVDFLSAPHNPPQWIYFINFVSDALSGQLVFLGSADTSRSNAHTDMTFAEFSSFSDVLRQNVLLMKAVQGFFYLLLSHDDTKIQGFMDQVRGNQALKEIIQNPSDALAS